MRHLYLLPLLSCLAVFAQAQISFSNQTTLLDDPTGFSSGVAVGVADMNGDGLDDIIRLENGSNLSIEYQGQPNMPFAHNAHGNIPGDAWALVIGDVNNDGWNDLLVGGAYDGVKMIAGSATGISTANLPETGTNGTFVQGSNFADINNDGWLDVFTCHDDGAPRIWSNDGTGSFAQANNWINMATTPASDNSGNYGSIWTDFDNDRDLDLYIAKCRQGVDDPTDPRRINALFVNDGQNNFSEQAGKHGLKIGWQSWTADLQDIDNDGDLDCLVTNHDYPLQLLLNDGAGHFTDIAASAGVDVSGNFIQGIMRDFDNDGLVDIITVGNFSSSTLGTHLFHNNGDHTFTSVTSPFGSASIGSMATGDLNGDGFLDVYAVYQSGFNNPTGVPDKLWMNTTANGNNYIAFDLKGSESNRMGVGARVEIHGPWGIQIREVHSGESYGIQNSLTQYFGIGTNTEVEYAVVHWPSGKMDVVKNPPINQKNTIVENVTCTLPDFTLATSGPAVICQSSSLTITAPAGFDYLWSDGSVSESITVSEAGNYSVVVVDGQGCVAASDVLKVVKDPDETPSLTLVGEEKTCEGSTVTLTSSEAAGYTWSTGETSQSINISQTGDYLVTIQGICNDFSSQAVHIEVLPSPAPLANDVFIPGPGIATLEATGDNLYWYETPTATDPVFIGPVFVTPTPLAATTTFYVEDQHNYGGGNFETGMPEHQGTNFFSGNGFNAQTEFEVYQPMRIKKVTMNTDMAGIRIIKLTTEEGTVVATKTLNLPVGETVADLDFEILDPGNYLLTTDSSSNQSVFGFYSPRLYRSNQGVSYPYTVPDLISITGSSLGSGFYYYFFDWQVEGIPTVCTSDRIPVTVTVGTSAAGEQLPFGRVSVQPNPSTGLFMLELEAIESGQASISVSDLAGQVVFGEKFEAMANTAAKRNIDLTNLPTGMYFLKITSGERSGVAKIVVERR